MTTDREGIELAKDIREAAFNGASLDELMDMCADYDGDICAYL